MDMDNRNTFLLYTLNAFLENSQDMIFVKDKNLVYIAASTTFANRVDKEDRKEIEGKTDFDIFPPELARKYTEDDRGVLDSGSDIINYIERIPDKDGKKSYSSTSKYIIRDEDGNIIGLYGVARDATAMMELEAARESSMLSRQMFDDVLEADLTEDRMLYVDNSDWGRLLQVQKDSRFSDIVEKMTRHFVHPDYADEFQSYYNIDKLREYCLEESNEFSHITYLTMKQGRQEWKWFKLDTRVYYSRVSGTLRCTTFLKDVDDEIRNKHQLQKEASTDPLTGLYNRNAVMSRISTHITGEGAERLHALLFIDLDNFKQVNDRWGHKFGDQVLSEIASRLREVFGSHGILGRIGGDEFLVFMNHMSSKEELEKQIGKAVKNLAFRRVKEEEEVLITCSIGAAVCMGDEDSAAGLCDKADQAMYRAKEGGRNRYCFYER